MIYNSINCQLIEDTVVYHSIANYSTYFIERRDLDYVSQQEQKSKQR